MRRVAHVSDLHFGREDPNVAAGLAVDLARQKADLVVVSGDLTQRARPAQFAAARRFLDALTMPWVAVPGNHDVPLFDVVRRAVRPFGRYRALVHQQLEPEWQDDELAVLGLNTVLPRVWKGGRVRSTAFPRLTQWSGKAGRRARIVFAHHPFTRTPASSADVVRRAKRAVMAMEEAGVDLLLTGHQHRFGHSETREYVVGGPHRLIVVRASTSISHRRRGEPNSYNLIQVHRDRFVVEGRNWDGEGFARATVHEYRRIPWSGKGDAAAPGSAPSLMAKSDPEKKGLPRANATAPKAPPSGDVRALLGKKRG
jgi:3',5'-cyclic AMP phosphodiesterase CpdA